MLQLNRLMLCFEPLGDNCEFGLVQRAAGAEPLGLLRFAGFHIPIEERLGRLVSALEARFEGLGAPASVRVEISGSDREFLVHEDAWNLMYHTAQHEGQVEPEVLLAQETQRLQFLRRKLLTDLRTGAKILVWKSNCPCLERDVERLVGVLRGFGPNTLLWVSEADARHASGVVETHGESLLKGYVERFAPYVRATDISPEPWFRLCEEAFRLTRELA